MKVHEQQKSYTDADEKTSRKEESETVSCDLRILTDQFNFQFKFHSMSCICESEQSFSCLQEQDQCICRSKKDSDWQFRWWSRYEIWEEADMCWWNEFKYLWERWSLVVWEDIWSRETE